MRSRPMAAALADVRFGSVCVKPGQDSLSPDCLSRTFKSHHIANVTLAPSIAPRIVSGI